MNFSYRLIIILGMMIGFATESNAMMGLLCRSFGAMSIRAKPNFSRATRLARPVTVFARLPSASIRWSTSTTKEPWRPFSKATKKPKPSSHPAPTTPANNKLVIQTKVPAQVQATQAQAQQNAEKAMYLSLASNNRLTPQQLLLKYNKDPNNSYTHPEHLEFVKAEIEAGDMFHFANDDIIFSEWLSDFTLKLLTYIHQDAEFAKKFLTYICWHIKLYKEKDTKNPSAAIHPTILTALICYSPNMACAIMIAALKNLRKTKATNLDGLGFFIIFNQCATYHLLVMKHLGASQHKSLEDCHRIIAGCRELWLEEITAK